MTRRPLVVRSIESTPRNLARLASCPGHTFTLVQRPGRTGRGVWRCACCSGLVSGAVHRALVAPLRKAARP